MYFYLIIFMQDSTERIDERKIKVIGHSLKILDKLFATYCSYINNEILSFVIELLLKMHRYFFFFLFPFLSVSCLIFKFPHYPFANRCSPLCLQKSKIDDKLIELINVHISRGSEPFFNTVFKSSDFKQVRPFY